MVLAAPARRKRKLSQAFTAAKDKNTKAIVKKNATSSPLLRLPPELRQKIWGYVLGNRLIHIDMQEVYRNSVYRGSSYWNLRYRNFLQRRLFNTICQSTVTEREAYELSKSAEYNKAATYFKAGEDMRACGNRHRACELELADHSTEKNLPPNRLNVGVLAVCRQVYVEVNPILWSTNTWSFQCNDTWRFWMSGRNALQKRLIKKIHFSAAAAYGLINKATILALKLAELNMDIHTWRQYRLMNCHQFLQAEKVSVIAADAWTTAHDNQANNETSFEEKLAIAEACHSHLATLQAAEARKKQEKERAKLLTEGEKGPEVSGSNNGRESEN
ncbi:hypothetical protein BGZ57DRAFT_580412 [Hyaloscypha finlandica]|nr:hypothetical protein BGZ57DRAFT_580412 [Hyaloscypha finlandica]